MLPAGKQRGSPTGGGNFYIFKKSTPAQQKPLQVRQVDDDAAARRQWSIETGYVASAPMHGRRRS